ncbi:MAG: patatin-like phospholipase family protein [Candidatus Omnitrophica bacterium]|nr:patatin-like phospholipase family protein [Candidatus Omnitrophota bacterium]
MTDSSKVIAVYSTTHREAKTWYAINLATALALITKGKVLFIDLASTLEYKISSDVKIECLKQNRIKERQIENIKKDYLYTIINASGEADESIYRIFTGVDAVHFFVDSTKDDLGAAHGFLEDLLEKGLESIHSKTSVIVNRLNIFDKFSKEEMAWLIKRDISAIVPEPGIMDAALDSSGTPLVLKSKDSSYSKAILRIAKKESGKLLGLALGSGAAFGLAHIGVLKVLEDRRIIIDVVSGSSIGALIAGMYGLGFSADKIKGVAKKLRSKLKILRLMDFTLPISGILAGKRMKMFLGKIFEEKTFEDLEIPVKIMVYDLANRETLVIEKGLLADAVYMSIAVPGIFKPKIEKERMIIDGGVSDPVPVDILLRQGVKKIIAVNVLPGPKDIHEKNMLLKKRNSEERNLMLTAPFNVRIGLSIMKHLRRIFTPNIFDVIMTTMQSMEYMLGENSCRKADVVLRPVLSFANSTDFHLANDFIKRGEEDALSHAEEIARLAEA